MVSLSVFAQEGTTLDEYRYLSKGYVYQLEMGLDAKKEGYQVKNLFQASNGADLVGLYQMGSAKPRALLVIIDDEKTKVSYVCIPNASADKRVKDLAKTDLRQVSSKHQSDYQIALNEFLFEALVNPSFNQMSSYTPPQKPMASRPATYQYDETLVSRSANKEQYLADNTPKPTEASIPQVKGGNLKAAVRSLHGEVAERSVIQSEEAYAKSSKRGVVAIKVCVDASGQVTSAKFTQRGSTTFDSYLKKIALKAAKNIKFAASDQTEQCGIVNYKF